MFQNKIFKNRTEAGQQLAKLFDEYRGRNDVIVYALPRGGVVLAYEIANYLKCPLDLKIVRKIGHPNNPEYAIAAVSENGELYENKSEVKNVDPKYYKEEIKNQLKEAQRRRDTYLGGKDSIKATDKIAIVVDDGIATGFTMKAAIGSLRAEKPKKLIVAVPVISQSSIKEFEKISDEMKCLSVEKWMVALSQFYKDFEQVEDSEVVELLNKIKQ
jgi:putative phosphoribosyl transferase